MTTPDNIPAADPAQKVAPCIGCGVPVHYTTTRRVCCPACAAERKRASARVAMEKQRRKRGVPKIKGMIIACATCGAAVVCNRRIARFCRPCVLEAGRDRARRVSREKSRARGAPEVGKPEVCKHCKDTFRRTSPRECYCPACKLLQERNELPHLKLARFRYWREIRRPAYHSDPEVRAHEGRLAVESRTRRKANPAFTINERMSAAIRGSLVGGKGGVSWQRLVGYTIDDLVRHLERQFTRGMSWDNRGDWEIDHIRPLSGFQYDSTNDPAFREAWGMANLRPLWGDDNRSKSATRTHLI